MCTTEELAGPAPPSGNPSSGHVWPAEAGREVLRELGRAGPPERRRDLVGRQGAHDGSGASDVIILQAGPWCLKTSRRRRFGTSEEGRRALVHLARIKSWLGSLAPERSTLILHPDGKGGHWLWTVSPWLPTLRSLMGDADARDDAEALGEPLVRYASSVVDALLLAARRRLVLDVHPSNFAVAGQRTVYIDDDVAEGDTLPTMGHAVLQRVHEYSRWPVAVDRYLGALESEMGARLSREEARRLGLGDILRMARVPSPPVREAKDRLVAVVDRGLRPSGGER